MSGWNSRRYISFRRTNWTSYNTTSHTNLVDNNIQAVFVDNQDQLWVGTDFGVSTLIGGVFTTYTETDGLGDNKIKCITQNQSGSILFGTNDGLSIFDGSSWTNYGMSDGLPFGGVNSIKEASNGDLYLGSGLGGTVVFDGTSFTALTTNDGLISNRIRSIDIDQSGNRWIGTSDGITVLDDADQLLTQHTRVYTLPAPDTLNPIEDISVDNSGNVWVGVYVDYLVTEGGVCGYNGNQWVEYHVSDGLIGPVIRTLAVDSDNNVWVGTSTGVSKISDHSLSIQENVQSNLNIYPNPSNGIFTIELDTVFEDVKIYDSRMRLIRVLNNSSTNLSLDLTAESMVSILSNLAARFTKLSTIKL